VIQELKRKGMLKIKVDGSFLTPTTLLEQMAFVEDLHAE